MGRGRLVAGGGERLRGRERERERASYFAAGDSCLEEGLGGLEGGQSRASGGGGGGSSGGGEPSLSPRGGTGGGGRSVLDGVRGSVSSSRKGRTPTEKAERESCRNAYVH